MDGLHLDYNVCRIHNLHQPSSIFRNTILNKSPFLLPEEATVLMQE